jgi:release factor glutamine methyltransferase
MWALELALPVPAAVADWGCGSGAIALALASERPDWQVSACDLSDGALDVADLNRHRLELPVRLLRSDWGAAFADSSLDLVASNPPYVAAGDPHLYRGDLPFEPVSALVAGEDGLGAIRRIISDAMRVLKPGGWLLLEHGYDQAGQVRALLEQAGFAAVSSREDLAGVERISGGQRP